MSTARPRHNPPASSQARRGRNSATPAHRRCGGGWEMNLNLNPRTWRSRWRSNSVARRASRGRDLLQLAPGAARLVSSIGSPASPLDVLVKRVP